MRPRRPLVALLAGAALALAAPSAASVTAGFDVAVNSPQVAGDPSSDVTAGFPTNKQNEPTIALNPVDSRFLVAGANDEQRQPGCGPGPVRGETAASDCSFVPGVGSSGVYTSGDGGQTWTNRGLLDDQPSWRGLGVVSDGDPVVAYGPKPDGRGGFSYARGARVYYSSLASVVGMRGLEYIVVAYSDDDGVTWSAPVVGTVKTAAADFTDKNWITVDATPSSPYFGRVYLSWTEFRSKTTTGNGSEPIMVATSTDGGLSFGAPKQVSPAGNNRTGNGRQGSASTVGPDGTVYVAFAQGSQQVLVVSRDGGQRWSRPAPVAAVVELQSPIPGAAFRVNSFPTIAADPRPGSTTVYAAWATSTPAGGRVVVARSTDRGSTWSAPQQVSGAEGYAFFPGIDVAPTGRVDVAYQALVARDPTTFGTGNATIDAWAVSSADGLSFSAPSRISTVSSDPAAGAQNNLQAQFWGDYSTLVSDGGRAWFIATDSRRGVGCPAVDAYQQALRAAGAAVRGDMADRLSQRQSGVNPALADPPTKPAPQLVCPAQFGNTDVRVSSFTP